MAEELTVLRRPVVAPPPTLRDMVAVLFRQGRLASFCFGVVFLTVLLYGLLAPNYEARMRILVRRGRGWTPL